MLWESIYKRYTPGVIPPASPEGQAFWFVFNSSRLLVSIVDDKAEIPCVGGIKDLNIKPLRSQYLGTLDGHHCFSVEVTADIEAPEGMVFRDLRSLFGLVEEDIFMLAGKALQIVAWDQTHQFCGRCGARTETKPDERAKVCRECGFISYPRISPAIIVAVVRDGKLLLAHANHFRSSMYSVIAGFVEAGETLEDCVKREVMEEVGIRVKNIKYFGSQPWPFPNSLMLAFTAEYDSGEIMVDGVEIGDAGWYSSSDFPETPSGYSVAGRLVEWFKQSYS